MVSHEIVQKIKEKFDGEKITAENIVSTIKLMNSEAAQFIKDKKERAETIKTSLKELKQETSEVSAELEVLIEKTVPDVVETISDVWTMSRKMLCSCF